LNAIGSRPNGQGRVHFSAPGQMGFIGAIGADELEALKRKGVVAGV
jgi:hypothetical protein